MIIIACSIIIKSNKSLFTATNGVIPAKAGIRRNVKELDSCFHRNDESLNFDINNL